MNNFIRNFLVAHTLVPIILLVACRQATSSGNSTSTSSSAASITGVVTTLAGSSQRAITNGTGTAARFYYPSSVATDATNDLIREIQETVGALRAPKPSEHREAPRIGTARAYKYP